MTFNRSKELKELRCALNAMPLSNAYTGNGFIEINDWLKTTLSLSVFEKTQKLDLLKEHLSELENAWKQWLENQVGHSHVDGNLVGFVDLLIQSQLFEEPSIFECMKTSAFFISQEHLSHLLRSSFGKAMVAHSEIETHDREIKAIIALFEPHVLANHCNILYKLTESHCFEGVRYMLPFVTNPEKRTATLIEGISMGDDEFGTPKYLALLGPVSDLSYAMTKLLQQGRYESADKMGVYFAEHSPQEFSAKYQSLPPAFQRAMPDSAIAFERLSLNETLPVVPTIPKKSHL